jgi:hypothetical protein
MPTCAKCQTDKAETEFRIRPDRNNWRLPNCKPCERVIQLDNYYKSKEENPLLWRLRVMRNNRSPHMLRQLKRENRAA